MKQGVVNTIIDRIPNIVPSNRKVTDLKNVLSKLSTNAAHRPERTGGQQVAQVAHCRKFTSHMGRKSCACSVLSQPYGLQGDKQLRR